jgi:hypothetical protein
VVIALNLVPFAGVAFLWFVGALRDRLGAREDRFFATVFLGSGLLLLAMLFTAAAVVGAIIIAFHAAPEALIDSATFHFGRGLAYGMINIYVVKTAAVFMITTSTIALYTRLTPRWLAFGGYASRCRALGRKLLLRLESSGLPVVGPPRQHLHIAGRTDASGPVNAARSGAKASRLALGVHAPIRIRHLRATWPCRYVSAGGNCAGGSGAIIGAACRPARHAGIAHWSQWSSDTGFSR